MATTESNLKEAFAGESQANRKYLAFARKAEQEGFANVARLFRTAAEAETIHALAHFNAMEESGRPQTICVRRLPGKPTNTPRCTPRCCSRRLPMTIKPSECSDTP